MNCLNFCVELLRSDCADQCMNRSLAATLYSKSFTHIVSVFKVLSNAVKNSRP